MTAKDLESHLTYVLPLLALLGTGPGTSFFHKKGTGLDLWKTRQMRLVNEPILLTVANPGPLTGPGNNTWLLDGEEPALIDAGTGSDDHISSIATHLDGRPLLRVLVTHGHPDHAAGVPALRARWPDIEAWKWPLAADANWQALRDGQNIRAGDRRLQVVHTPGHAPDHVCFWDSEHGDLFAGDMIIQGTTVMIPAGRGGNLRDYMQSLEQMARLTPRRVLPGHGPVVERPLELIAAYLEHRRLREEQVRACLVDGVSDVNAIVARLYPAIPDEVRAAARLTVEAHLEKLEEDRKA